MLLPPSLARSMPRFRMLHSPHRKLVMEHQRRLSRRFAPLNISVANSHDAVRLRGIVFDMDGTLCLPQNYMFKQMRAALDIPKSVDILDHILTLSDAPDSKEDSNSSPRSRAQDAIKAIESKAMTNQQPQPGLNELITYLAEKNLHLSLCTRNFELPVNHLLEKFVSEEGRAHFYPLITREAEGIKPKPSPEGIWACVQAWDQPRSSNEDAQGFLSELKKHKEEADRMRMCEGVIMVGDSVDDIEAGARAGAATVLLLNDENKHLMEATEWPKRIDLSISRLDELIDVLDNGFCGRD